MDWNLVMQYLSAMDIPDVVVTANGLYLTLANYTSAGSAWVLLWPLMLWLPYVPPITEKWLVFLSMIWCAVAVVNRYIWDPGIRAISFSILNSKTCNSLALLLARHGNTVATCCNDAFRDNCLRMRDLMAHLIMCLNVTCWGPLSLILQSISLSLSLVSRRNRDSLSVSISCFTTFNVQTLEKGLDYSVGTG